MTSTYYWKCVAWFLKLVICHLEKSSALSSFFLPLSSFQMTCQVLKWHVICHEFVQSNTISMFITFLKDLTSSQKVIGSVKFFFVLSSFCQIFKWPAEPQLYPIWLYCSIFSTTMSVIPTNLDLKLKCLDFPCILYIFLFLEHS